MKRSQELDHNEKPDRSEITAADRGMKGDKKSANASWNQGEEPWVVLLCCGLCGGLPAASGLLFSCKNHANDGWGALGAGSWEGIGYIWIYGPAIWAMGIFFQKSKENFLRLPVLVQSELLISACFPAGELHVYISAFLARV